MENTSPRNTNATGQPSSGAPSCTHVLSRARPAASAYITSVAVHPVEPFQVVGLSSGEVCLYTATTDALSWLVEMDAARQAQLRFDHATRIPSSATQRSCGSKNSSNDVAAASAVAAAPPEYPLKVLSFAPLSSSSASTSLAADGCAILHCGFLRGREDDLVREVVQPCQPSLATSSAESFSVARHLLYVVTSANDVFVVDIKSEVLLVCWGVTATTSSPLHPKFIITQVETYGALLFLTVAHRSAVQTSVAALGKDDADRGRGPERNALDRCNEPCVYVLHLGYTKPFAAAGTKGLVVDGGAYVIRAVSQDKRKLREPVSPASPPSLTTAAGAATRRSLSIRVHPFAPLVMLVLNRTEVQVFALDGDERDVTPKKAQLVLFNSPLSSTSSKGAALAAASSTATPPAPLLDVQFVPSAAVLVRNPDHAAASSSAAAARCRWGCRNVQILLLSSTRLRLVCTRSAFTGDAAGSAATVAVDRAFFAAPEIGATLDSAAAVPSLSLSSSSSSRGQVCFLRAWTWLASPDTFFVLQSDRTVLELSCNDLLAASMEVPAVRSRRLLPPRTVVASAELRNGSSSSSINDGGCVGDWWLIPPTANGLPYAETPDVLPLWGRGAVLSGVFAPRLPAYHSDSPQTLVFSRLTGLARPLPIRENEEDAVDHPAEGEGEREQPVDSAASTFHLSLLADTETLSSRCIAIRLCLTRQCAAVTTGVGTAASSPNSSAMPEQCVVPESVNVNIARVLCGSAAPALCCLEHGFYFVGSREESAYSDYPFLVAGLQYVDDVVVPEVGSGGSMTATQASRDAQLRVAMVCLPADRRELRRLYDTAKAGCGSGSGDGCASFTPALAPSADLKRTLQQAVHHTQVQTLPIPQFDFEAPQAGKMTKQLVSCAFQLSNDGVVPCVWGLWAPVFPYSRTTAASATMGSSLPPPQSLQLTMQSFYVAAESQQLLWRPPELVQMDDLLASNPSQVFALNSVLTKGGSLDAPAVMATLPAPYNSIDDVLLDVDAAVVARLFLYYADCKVLVLATVETGSSSEAGFDSEVIDDTYNFASRARNGRVMGGRLFTGGGGGAQARGDGRQYLRLVPHAAAEMNEWKGDNTAESLSCALLSAVQLSVVLVNDHGEPALQVAVTSRRFGVALALFPLAGRRGAARVSATLQPVKVYLYRRWAELLCVTTAAAADTQQADENERSRQGASGDRGTTSTSPASTALGLDDVQHSPLLRRYRTWVDTIAFPGTTYASIPLAQWVWPPAWPGINDDDDYGGGGRGDGDERKDEKQGRETEAEAEEKDKKEGQKQTRASRSAAAAANPVLLLQRGRALYVLHRTGAAVQMCSSLLHCAPLQVVPRAASSAAATTQTELYLQHGSYPGLLARNRLLRQLQLQYGPYNFYADATVSSQMPAVKVKWFKKFLKTANSAEAARRRAQERAHHMAWLQRVYNPSADDLAYQFSSSSSSLPPQISAALEHLVGAGVTHVGNVIDVNFTDPIRLATLAVEALAASQGMQQLISSAGMLTDSLRQTLRHLTTVLEHSGPARDNSNTNNNNDSPATYHDDTPMSVMRGNWAVAEALARLPLGCVMEVIGQEVRRAACFTARANDDRGGVSGTRKRRRLSELQRWWWLLMRCSALVTAVNTAQTDVASRVMEGVFNELPLSSPLLRPPAGEEAVTSAVSQALLLCSPRFMPDVVAQMLENGTKSVTQQLQRLEAAVKAALVVLGAEETKTATPAPPTPLAGATDGAAAPTSPNEEEQPAPADEAVEGDSAQKSASKSKNNQPSPAATTTTSCWSSLFSTVRMDGARWTHAVYYTNLLTHLRHLSAAETSNSNNNNNNSSRDKVRALAAQCLAGADAAVEASAAAVLDVATQTVGVLLGAVVDVPAASRSRMVNAVAQSTSKRQQMLRKGNEVARAPTAATASTDVSFAEEDVYFLNQTPIDQLRHSLYVSQWRDLYGTYAYPTLYFFHSTAASAAAQNAGTVPYQLSYNAQMSGARAYESATAAQPAADAAPSATRRHHRGRVQRVLLTEHTTATSDPAAVPPTMEIVPAPSSPQLPATTTASNNNNNNSGSSNNNNGVGGGGGGGGDSHSATRAAAVGTQQSPLSLRAAVEKQEADLRNIYFNGFAAHEDDEDEMGAKETAAGGPSDSAVQRESQKTAERRKMPDASAFAPSATRRATSAAASGAGYESTPGSNAYGDNLYGAVPSQQAFFARFQAEEKEA